MTSNGRVVQITGMALALGRRLRPWGDGSRCPGEGAEGLMPRFRGGSVRFRRKPRKIVGDSAATTRQNSHRLRWPRGAVTSPRGGPGISSGGHPRSGEIVAHEAWVLAQIRVDAMVCAWRGRVFQSGHGANGSGTGSPVLRMSWTTSATSRCSPFSALSGESSSSHEREGNWRPSQHTPCRPATRSRGRCSAQTRIRE